MKQMFKVIWQDAASHCRLINPSRRRMYSYSSDLNSI